MYFTTSIYVFMHYNNMLMQYESVDFVSNKTFVNVFYFIRIQHFEKIIIAIYQLRTLIVWISN